MRLADVFAAIEPLLDGTGDAQGVAEALHGAARAREVAGLQIYGETCAKIRHEAVAALHASTRAAMIARVGEEAWSRWVDAYFRERPVDCFELNENVSGFAAFVAARPGVPAWLGDLAALEWATWRAESAPDDPRDSPDGPLRAATSLVVLRSGWDLIEWLAGESPADEPVRTDSAVIVWRDGELDACRAAPTNDELAAIEAALAEAPTPWGDREVLADLHAAGILVGAEP